jgi:hypothetical protein
VTSRPRALYQLDPKATAGTTVIPTRAHVAEQVLSGVWGTSAAKPTAFTNNGCVNLQGTGPTAGVINFNLLGAAQIGDFQSCGGFAADGNALVAALKGGINVNVTLTPLDYFINPPANNPVLGQDDVGKGASDITFPVVVQQAGIYPLRLVHYQGGGGGNCEFFSITGTNRVLINDRTATTGPGPGGSGLRAWYDLVLPIVSVSQPEPYPTYP